jgi:hypothetical protein
MNKAQLERLCDAASADLTARYALTSAPSAAPTPTR